jgi:copper chaperone CopZ
MGTIASFLRRIGRPHSRVEDSVAVPDGDTVDLELRIPNMVCEGCAEKIEGVLRTLPGVRNVRSDVWQKRICVRFVMSQQLKDALTTAGFTAAEGL